MTDLSVVDEAVTWADWLVRREHRGPGDTVEAARLRTAQKHKVPERLLWTLRYRKPKRIWADLHRKLELAVAAEISRQEKCLEHEIEITRVRRLSPSGVTVVDAASALLAAPDQPATRAPTERT